MIVLYTTVIKHLNFFIYLCFAQLGKKVANLTQIIAKQMLLELKSFSIYCRHSNAIKISNHRFKICMYGCTCSG